MSGATFEEIGRVVIGIEAQDSDAQVQTDAQAYNPDTDSYATEVPESFDERVSPAGRAKQAHDAAVRLQYDFPTP